MPRYHFTARWVDAVKPPSTGQVDYFDTSPPGVGLRVAPSGRKTWVVMYRAHGRLRRLTLGTYPALRLADAREKALAVKHAVAQGEDPAAQKHEARHAPLLADIAEQYLDKYAKVRKKSWREEARLLAKDVLPAWGRRQAVDISRRDVLALLDEIVARGAPIQANRVLALVRRVYNWAISRDLLEHNPCLQVKAPGKEHQRSHIIPPRVWIFCTWRGSVARTGPSGNRCGSRRSWRPSRRCSRRAKGLSACTEGGAGVAGVVLAGAS